MCNHVAIHDNHPASPNWRGKDTYECPGCDKELNRDGYCNRCTDEIQAMEREVRAEVYHPGKCAVCNKPINYNEYFRVDDIGNCHSDCSPPHLHKSRVMIA